jgi:RHS repeat-associated protein
MNLIRKKLIAILAGVFFTFIPHLTAPAHYDPGVQRWINRDPLGEPGFELIRDQPTSVLGGEPHRYLFVANNPISRTDSLGLKVDCEALIEKAWFAFSHAAGGGTEFVDALNVFGGCNSLGLAMFCAKEKYKRCMEDAITGDATTTTAAEKACDDKWKKKINMMQKVNEKECVCKKK